MFLDYMVLWAMECAKQTHCAAPLVELVPAAEVERDAPVTRPRFSPCGTEEYVDDPRAAMRPSEIVDERLRKLGIGTVHEALRRRQSRGGGE